MTKKDTSNPTTEVAEFDPSVLEGLTPEEIMELYQATGQEALQTNDRLPSIRVNKYAKKDVNGNTVAVGNWVRGQKMKIEGDKKTCEFIGDDLGPAPEVILYKVARQYSYWNEDAKLRCNSQIVLEKGDVPMGNNLGFRCAVKDECPRRKQGILKGERCSCQLIVAGTTADGQPFMNYVKGDSYIPMQDYVNSFGANPIFAFKTILEYDEKSKGDNDYYVVKPKRGAAVGAIEFKENFNRAREVHKNMETFKAQQELKMKQQQIGHTPVVTDAPNNVTIVNVDDNSDIKF